MQFSSPAVAPDALAVLAERARATMRASRAASTIANARIGYADFAEWCEDVGRSSLPADPETVQLYLQHRAGTLKIGTLLLRRHAISFAHEAALQPDPTMHPHVRRFVQGLRRVAATKGQRTRKMAALRSDALRKAVAALPDNLLGKRDRALLLIGFAGALRRGEIVALDFADVAFGDEGVIVTVRRGKTDQEGAGADVSIPFGRNPATCPVRALQTWCVAAKIESGAIFRRIDRHGRIHNRLSVSAILRIVRRSVERVGLDPAEFGAHSLRRGFATTAAQSGVTERALMKHGRWKNADTCRGYIEEGSRWQDNAAAAVGL